MPTTLLHNFYYAHNVKVVLNDLSYQRVRVMEATVGNQWRIGLPNGVSVAFAGEVDTQALTAILHIPAQCEYRFWFNLSTYSGKTGRGFMTNHNMHPDAGY